MAKLTPYLFSRDARTQAEFYANALGGEILSVLTHGDVPGSNAGNKEKVMHLVLSAAGVTFFMTDDPQSRNEGDGNISLSLEFGTDEETREAYGKLSEGGVVVHPLEHAFWGPLFGQFTDRFGVRWMLSTESPETR